MLYSFQQTISWKIKVIFEYNATPDNKIQWSAIEKFEFNNDGLIEKSNVCYGAEDCRRKVEGNKMSIEKGRIWYYITYSIDLQFVFSWTVQVGLSYNRLTIKYGLVFSFVKINTRLNLFSY